MNKIITFLLFLCSSILYSKGFENGVNIEEILKDIDFKDVEYHLEDMKPDPKFDSSKLDTVFQLILGKLFSFVDPIQVPFIPTISINPRDDIDVAFSLTDVKFEGLQDVQVLKMDLPVLDIFGAKPFEIDLLFPQLKLTAQYSSGGWIINLPFSGESFLYVSLEDIYITVEMNFDVFDIIPNGDVEFCIEEGTTVNTFEITKPVIYFDNLNPGTDQGILINSVLDASIQDVADALAKGLSGSAIDVFFVETFNSIFCRSIPLNISLSLGGEDDL